MAFHYHTPQYIRHKVFPGRGGQGGGQRMGSSEAPCWFRSRVGLTLKNMESEPLAPLTLGQLSYLMGTRTGNPQLRGSKSAQKATLKDWQFCYSTVIFVILLLYPLHDTTVPFGRLLIDVHGHTESCWPGCSPAFSRRPARRQKYAQS